MKLASWDLLAWRSLRPLEFSEAQPTMGAGEVLLAGGDRDLGGEEPQGELATNGGDEARVPCLVDDDLELGEGERVGVPSEQDGVADGTAPAASMTTAAGL
eukprot:8710089-Alexandrium_andersonii.AAC.1